jgi:3-isopropylmalate/(R)-2-methylmalate dehydratase large subunit
MEYQPQTLTQKILSKASGRNYVAEGELIWSNVDILMSHDPCAPGIISVLKKEFGNNAKVWDKDKIVFIPDHFVYSADSSANSNIRVMREFAREQDIKYFYDVGTPQYKGVCHIGLAEGRHALPGNVLIGTDSHTVTSGAFGTFAIGVGITDAAFVLGTGQMLIKVPKTIRVDITGKMPRYLQAKDIILSIIGELSVDGATYKTIEFGGSVIDEMSVEERMTICNMVVECGAKNGIMVPNKKTIDFLSERKDINYDIICPDPDAAYEKTINLDVTTMEPIVAKPHSPDNIDVVSNLKEVELQQAYIGSCTGGKLEDFKAAAKILFGNKVSIKTYAVPATKEVLNQIILTKINGISIYEIFINSGVIISADTSCAACCGGPADTFGRVNDVINVISTTNRNFVGRMGNKEAKIYLASPYTVAASAITGFITDPKLFLEKI